MTNIRKTAVWMFAVWRAYRFYHRKGVLFSHRQAFLYELRPYYASKYPLRIDYPDAFMFVSPADVDRAIAWVRTINGEA